MKPLVYFCRWQAARLRLQGRDQEAVWGHLIFQTKDGHEKEREFRFHLADSILTLKSDSGDEEIRLDELGVPLEEDN